LHDAPRERCGGLALRGSAERRLTNARYTRVMSETLDLTILYEDGEEGWIVASIPAVPGALSQGRDRKEARDNVLDALGLMLSAEPGEARERELLHLKVA
jgi:predicted RNase H-like HicB family nuclease